MGEPKASQEPESALACDEPELFTPTAQDEPEIAESTPTLEEPEVAEEEVVENTPVEKVPELPILEEQPVVEDLQSILNKTLEKIVNEAVAKYLEETAKRTAYSGAL